MADENKEGERLGHQAVRHAGLQRELQQQPQLYQDAASHVKYRGITVT